MTALWILLALAAAAFFFILGWASCHQSQADARKAQADSMERMMASNGIIINASRNEDEIAARLQAAGERFAEFKTAQGGLARTVDELAQRVDAVYAGLTAQGVLTKNVERAGMRPARRTFSGSPSDPNAPPPLDPPGKGGGGTLDSMLT
jgi:hypothetical protein